MDNEFLETVLYHYKQNDWQNILKLNEHSDNQTALKLLWVWPSIENLDFVKKTIEYNNCHGIISLGCGCGLLEWIIQKSTGTIELIIFDNRSV